MEKSDNLRGAIGMELTRFSFRNEAIWIMIFNLVLLLIAGLISTLLFFLIASIAR